MLFSTYQELMMKVQTGLKAGRHGAAEAVHKNNPNETVHGGRHGGTSAA